MMAALANHNLSYLKISRSSIVLVSRVLATVEFRPRKCYNKGNSKHIVDVSQLPFIAPTEQFPSPIITN